MRQALIIENPKWEPFTAASEKFKALSGNAILVVRGRVKEMNPKVATSPVYKKIAETAEEHAADLRKLGKKPEEITTALKAWKAPSKEEIARAKDEALARAQEAASTTREKPKLFKKPAQTAEEHAVDLRKLGKKPEEIEAAIKSFKAPKK